MPTLIVLDASLGMVCPYDDEGNVSFKEYATSLIHQLMDEICAVYSEEYFALMSFAESVRMELDFTRDIHAVHAALENVVTGTWPEYPAAFQEALSTCFRSWSSLSFCNCFLFTTGTIESPWTLPDEFFDSLARDPIAFHVFLFAAEGHCCNVDIFQRIADAGRWGSSVHHVPWSQREETSTALIPTMVKENYGPHEAVLRFGNLSSRVHLVPHVRPVVRVRDLEIETYRISSELIILGTLKPTELASPTVVARFHVVPVLERKDAEHEGSFFTLLVGSLKPDGVVPFCEIGNNWFGYLTVLNDSKRSSLLLNCLIPGTDTVSWLGLLDELVHRPHDSKSVFPVANKKKPSYATTAPCWMNSFVLQTDLQKILRYTRKLPEKEAIFFQELGRVCAYAQLLGFTDLQQNIVQILEKEKQLSVSVEAKKTLNHVVHILKSGLSLKWGEPFPQPKM